MNRVLPVLTEDHRGYYRCSQRTTEGTTGINRIQQRALQALREYNWY